MFTTDYKEILQLVDQIDPERYGKTRNFVDGAVTRLSPYIARGVLSTRQVAKAVFSKGYHPARIEIFLKELAWRDYFQQVWVHQGDRIDSDLKQPQDRVSNRQLADSILAHTTGIAAVDRAIQELYDTGYMHNHARMYVASLCCNLAQSHWYKPARWMYYHLLDADWASNALSWQWVAGSFSSKKYYANQENINRYFHTDQSDTFLDVSYDAFEQMGVPQALESISDPVLTTPLPTATELLLNPGLPSCIYNFYNLDPEWLRDRKANRILLLEPAFFEKYPVCERTLQFIRALSDNIEDMQVFVGDFDALYPRICENEIHYKEHPTNTHYKGEQHARDWMFPEVKGYFPSFFAYWKKCEKVLAQASVPFD